MTAIWQRNNVGGMPLYEYRCTACDERFARAESIAAHDRRSAGPTCPKCNSSAVERVISPFFAKTVRKS